MNEEEMHKRRSNNFCHPNHHDNSFSQQIWNGKTNFTEQSRIIILVLQFCVQTLLITSVHLYVATSSAKTYLQPLRIDYYRKKVPEMNEKVHSVPKQI